MGKNLRVHSRQQRVATLLLSKQLGVSKASRETGISRSTIYEWAQRFEEQGLDGLVPLPPPPRTHPQATTLSATEQITELALAHPSWGCDRVAEVLSGAAPSVSPTTIQKILNKRGLGTRAQRWLALEQRVEDKEISLTTEQHDFVFDRNPCFPKCTFPKRGPGDVMHAGIWRIGRSESRDDVCILAMIDACSAFAFGTIINDPRRTREVPLLNRRVKEFYRIRHLRIHKILITDIFNSLDIGVGLYSSDGSLSCVGAMIKHKSLKRPFTQRPCCMLRFQKTVMSEFIRGSRRRKKNINVDTLNRDFQKWLESYNWSRAHEGYPNWGKVPGHVFG